METAIWMGRSLRFERPVIPKRRITKQTNRIVSAIIYAALSAYRSSASINATKSEISYSRSTTPAAMAGLQRRFP
jgi:hypothetical protein